MKNLVLGALLAAAVASTACTAVDTSAVITARWSFNTYANKDGPANAACPTGFDTATVYVRPWDPFVGDFTGEAIPSDFFNCSDKIGTTDPLDGIFQVWVQIEDHDGRNVYATSAAVVIDTADGNATIDLPTLFLDAGYFDLSWDLLREGSTQRMRCDEAGLTSASRISTVAVAVSNNAMITDKFSCDDGYGITSELPIGLYDVTVTVSSMPGQDIGASGPLADKEIRAHTVTPLGHVKIIFAN